MKKESFYIDSSNNSYEIFCDLYLPENESIEKIIIACHGFGGDKNSSAILMLAKTLTKYNIGVLAFDFPGHGISNASGYEYTLENCIGDINDVEEYIKKELDIKNIGFFATSFGAYAVLLKINRDKKIYSSIILRCPALNMKSIFENSILRADLKDFIKKGECELGFERKIIVTKRFYEELIKNDIFKLYNTKNEIVIIHGTKDDVAPIEDSIKFRNKFKNIVKLFKVEGADHRFKKEGELEQVIEIAKNSIL